MSLSCSHSLFLRKDILTWAGLHSPSAVRSPSSESQDYVSTTKLVCQKALTLIK